MEPQFGPLALASLSQGETAAQFDRTLAEVAQQLHDYCLEHGYDETKKTSAEVTLKVKVQHLESGLFSVRATVGHKLPTAPDTAQPLVTVNGRLLAPLAPELTKHDDPRQRTFAHVNPENPGEKKL